MSEGKYVYVRSIWVRVKGDFNVTKCKSCYGIIYIFYFEPFFLDVSVFSLLWKKSFCCCTAHIYRPPLPNCFPCLFENKYKIARNCIFMFIYLTDLISNNNFVRTGDTKSVRTKFLANFPQNIYY